MVSLFANGPHDTMRSRLRNNLVSWRLKAPRRENNVSYHFGITHRTPNASVISNLAMCYILRQLNLHIFSRRLYCSAAVLLLSGIRISNSIEFCELCWNWFMYVYLMLLPDYDRLLEWQPEWLQLILCVSVPSLFEKNLLVQSGIIHPFITIRCT